MGNCVKVKFYLLLIIAVVFCPRVSNANIIRLDEGPDGFELCSRAWRRVAGFVSDKAKTVSDKVHEIRTKERDWDKYHREKWEEQYDESQRRWDEIRKDEKGENGKEPDSDSPDKGPT